MQIRLRAAEDDLIKLSNKLIEKSDTLDSIRY